jgi:NDP-sugar pyrophosphorylase family protein
MKKEKIAISIDRPTLEMVDAMVDSLTIRSRSQAVEFLIAKGIEHQYVKDAVILIKGDDARILLKMVEKKPLLAHQLDWLAHHGVQHVSLVTGESPMLRKIREVCEESMLRVRIVIDEKETGTVQALGLCRKELRRSFIVLLGDTLNRFDLTKMILFHLKHDRIATVGLISTTKPSHYSTVDLEGDRIVEFRKEGSESHIIDAGIYIFKPMIFKHLNGKLLDRDVFPTLCHTNDIKGYFTFGRYLHLSE